MKLAETSPQRRLYIASAIILLVGLGVAALIYLSAANASQNSMIRDFQNSKRYVHDLELYGGKMNVLADRFLRWFSGFWHGRALAFTVGFIALVISSALILVAYRLPSDEDGGPAERDGRQIN